MEDLNKTQLVLLTLLVSFVTSIATGIITVSLLQEAPTEIVQTINRVVEKTIEQVSPTQGGSEKIKEVTVVVNEEDRVIEAIQKNDKNILRIRYNPAGGETQFYGAGLFLTKDGLVVTDRRVVYSPTYSYKGVLSDGIEYDLRLLADDALNGLVFFEIIKSSQTKLSAEPVIFSSAVLNLGQTIISIGGQEKNSVSIGRISSLITSPESKKITFIESDIVFKSSVYGGPLLNLSGDVVGMRISNENRGDFISADLIQSSRKALGL